MDNEPVFTEYERNKRTTGYVLHEKLQDRGWGPYAPDEFKGEGLQVEPLAYTYEEFETFLRLLSKLILTEQNPALVDLYEAIIRRGTLGNKYPIPNSLQEINETIWNIGESSREPITNLQGLEDKPKR